MMDLLFRHLMHHWRLNLAMLVCLTLASAVVGSVSGYTTALSAEELNQSLERAGPAGRSLRITGSLDTSGEELSANLANKLGKLWQDRLVIRHATLKADPQSRSEMAEAERAVVQLDVYSFDTLAENVQLLAGRLPAPASLIESVGYWPPPVEAVIGREAAAQSGYGIGDRLSASGSYQRLDIVGVVEPLDPDDDLWGGDLGAFVAATDQGLGEGAIGLPLIIASESMQSFLGRPVFPHVISWRISLDRQRMGPATVRALYENLVSFQTQSIATGAATSSGLLEVLKDFLAWLSRLRVALWLLAAQSLILILYALSVFTPSVVERSQAEMAMLSARGLSAWQVTCVFGLESLLLMLLAALLLGPGLGQGVAYLWATVTSTGLPDRLSGELWLLSAVAPFLGWLAWVLSISAVARRYSRAPQPRQARPAQQSVLHKRYLDLYLLAFGGLLVWQLNQSGSFLSRAVSGSRFANTSLADPLLLLGPLLLLIGAAMAFLRIVPAILSLVAQPVRRWRGAAFPLGLLRAARNPLHASRIVLLVSLAAGMMFFARILRDSLAYSWESQRADRWVDGIASAFQLDACMLVVFSMVIFFLPSWLATQGNAGPRARTPDLYVLRTLGLPPSQWPIPWVTEGISVLMVGLLAGAAVGLGLSYAMIPYLSQALLEPLAGVAISRIVTDWPAIARLYTALIAAYGLALALLWSVVAHRGAHWAQWGEDE